MKESFDTLLSERLATQAGPFMPPDFADVRRRALRTMQTQRQPRRALRKPSRIQIAAVAAALIASAIAAFATPLGAAIGNRFDGFSGWLTGEPGTKATSEEQQSFEAENSRSWAAFPAGTELRRLLQTDASGTTFTLFGFRSGDALCLRLVATGSVAGTSSSCAPLNLLQTSNAPAFVIATDASFGATAQPAGQTGYVPAVATATFGIVSDGVTGVSLIAGDGSHDALVGSNAFLYIDDHPKLGERVRSATATAADGATTPLPLARAPFGTNSSSTGAQRSAQGPSGIERKTGDGTIAWINQQQHRGDALSPEMLDKIGHILTDVSFARELQPDPASPVHVVFMVGPGLRGQAGQQQQICVFLVSAQTAAGGCSQLTEVFSRQPFSAGVSTAQGGDQYAYLSGAASDEVASIKIFLANGVVEDVPLADNAYAVPVERTLFPVRVIAYDANGEIVGNQVVANR